MDKTTQMLAIKKLTYTYPKKETPVFKDLSFQIPAESTLAVIGPSGSGKTTLLRIIAGLTMPYSGKVEFLGKEIDKKKLTIGFMPQSYGLLPWKNVKENIFLGKTIKKGKIFSKSEEYQSLLGELGLLQLEKCYPKEISGGQQQRVALGRVFFLNADLLLMDEPFSALDALTREEMQDIFLRLWHKRKTTTILVTHYIEEAILLGERIIVLASDGSIIYNEENDLFGSFEKREEGAFLTLVTRLRQELQKSRKGD